MFEAVTGCETKNKYLLFAADPLGNQVGAPLFQAKEDSSCCARICCPGDCRPYKMMIKDMYNLTNTLSHGKRDFKCTCLCANRPEIILFDGETEEK